jgi:hypothetical protein
VSFQFLLGWVVVVVDNKGREIECPGRPAVHPHDRSTVDSFVCAEVVFDFAGLDAETSTL